MKKREIKNMKTLQKLDGTTTDDEKEMKDLINNYYKEIFSL